MRDQQHIFDEIEDYLHQRMSEKERIAFEQKLEVDKALAAKVEEAKATDEAIHFACLANLKKTVGQDIKKIKYQSGWKNQTYLLIGSAILVTALAGLYTFTKDSKEKTASSNPPGKEIFSDNIVVDKKQDSLINELPPGKKKNSDPFIPSAKETEEDSIKDQKPAELSEKTASENSDRQHAPDEGTHVAPAARDSNNKKSAEPSSFESAKNCDKKFDIRTEPSCKNKENGSITIATEGGNEFIFQVDHHIANGARGIFHDLSAGEHKVLVTYDKECTFTKTVKIEEKWCPLNQPFSFNPDYQEKWEIRYENGAEGKFIIYDRSGREVYKSAFGAGNEYWTGTDMNGHVVPMGNYAAILYYSDGRKEKVDLTIIR